MISFTAANGNASRVYFHKNLDSQQEAGANKKTAFARSLSFILSIVGRR